MHANEATLVYVYVYVCMYLCVRVACLFGVIYECHFILCFLCRDDGIGFKFLFGGAAGGASLLSYADLWARSITISNNAYIRPNKNGS